MSSKQKEKDAREKLNAVTNEVAPRYAYNEASKSYTVTTLTLRDSIESGEYGITQDPSTGQVFCYKLDPPDKILYELPELQNQYILSVIRNFWKRKQDYKDGNEYISGGQTHKAGVLLYGPPGSGKTSSIKLLSKSLVEDQGLVFYVSRNVGVAAKFLEEFFKVEKDRNILVIIEDIDAIINEEGDHQLLQMLDSNTAIDNVVFLATTNYPDRLSPRFYDRPGRFSYVVEIDYPTAEARKAYLEAVLKKHDDVERIVSMTEGFTIDHLTALLNQVYREGQDLETVVRRLQNFWDKPPVNTENKKKRKIGLGI